MQVESEIEYSVACLKSCIRLGTSADAVASGTLEGERHSDIMSGSEANRSALSDSRFELGGKTWRPETRRQRSAKPRF